MSKSTISVIRLPDGSMDVVTNTPGATAAINIPADVAKIMLRELGEAAFSSFTWSNDSPAGA